MTERSWQSLDNIIGLMKSIEEDIGSMPRSYEFTRTNSYKNSNQHKSSTVPGYWNTPERKKEIEKTLEKLDDSDGWLDINWRGE